MPQNYDLIAGKLDGVGLHSRPVSITDTLPFIGLESTDIMRAVLEDGNTVVFWQHIDAEGSLRVVLPPKLVAAIVRADAQLREKAADRRSAERKAADAERERVKRAKATLARRTAKRREARDAKVRAISHEAMESREYATG